MESPVIKSWEKLWSLEGLRGPGVLAGGRHISRSQRKSPDSPVNPWPGSRSITARKRNSQPKTKLKPFTTEEKEARRQRIEENHRRREAEIEARRARGEFKDMDDKIARWAKQTQEKLAIRGKRSRAT